LQSVHIAHRKQAAKRVPGGLAFEHLSPTKAWQAAQIQRKFMAARTARQPAQADGHHSTCLGLGSVA
jgi:hypothetical protein